MNTTVLTILARAVARASRTDRFNAAQSAVREARAALKIAEARTCPAVLSPATAGEVRLALVGRAKARHILAQAEREYQHVCGYWERIA